MQAIYRPIFKQALFNTWKYKYLWFFGLFAAFLGNGIVNLFYVNLDIIESQGSFLIWAKDFWHDLNLAAVGNNWLWLGDFFDFWGVMIFIVIIIIGVFFLWLSIISQGALIASLKRGNIGKTGKFSEYFKIGMHNFWALLVLNFISRMMALLLFILLGWPFMVMFLNSNGSFVSQTLMVLMSFIILGPIAIIINFIVLFAVIYRVNEREHTAVSLKKAWLFFKQNWVVTVEMSFLLFLMVNVAASIILVIAAVVVSLPFVMLGMIASYVGSEVFLWATIGVGILCLVIMIVLYGALAGVYQNACWVMLFERIQDGPAHSKILRLVTWFVSGSKSDEDKKLKAQKVEEGKIGE